MDSFETNIPARMDRLPWSRFHWRIVLALGITWVLDGLEVTIIGALGPVLQNNATLGFSIRDIGLLSSLYLVGAVAGAILFGGLTDRRGRRFVFYVTLGIYLVGVLSSAMAWNFASFALSRLLTGFGIGGEYAAINSAIDEMIPARYRGRVDLFVNGSFWLGAALGAAVTPIILDTDLLPVNFGWRLGFAVGGILGLGILLLRRHVPESPRWLVTHGRRAEAEATVTAIERDAAPGRSLPPVRDRLTIHPQTVFGFAPIMRAVFGAYKARSALALTLMVAQAFLYNAVFFTYGLVLVRFQHVPDARTGLYILPLALGNLLGPLCLGYLFDTVGRRRMIAGTFIAAAILLIVTAWLFARGDLTAMTQTLCWIAIFFFASAAASSAYLTASEIFPLETRALAIAFFYSAGTAVGGIVAPSLFAKLIESGQSSTLALGYGGAASLLLIAGVVEAWLGIDAEGKSLEAIAVPISSSK